MLPYLWTDFNTPNNMTTNPSTLRVVDLTELKACFLKILSFVKFVRL